MSYGYNYLEDYYHGFSQATDLSSNRFEIKLWNGRRVSNTLPPESNWNFIGSYPMFYPGNLIVTYDRDTKTITVYGQNINGEPQAMVLFDKYTSYRRDLDLNANWLRDTILNDGLFIHDSYQYGIKVTAVQYHPVMFYSFTIQLIENLEGRIDELGQVPQLVFPTKYGAIQTAPFRELQNTNFLITYNEGLPVINAIFPNPFALDAYLSQLNDLLYRYWIEDEDDYNFFYYRYDQRLRVRFTRSSMNLTVSFLDIIVSQATWPTQKLHQYLLQDVPSLKANPDKYQFEYNILAPGEVTMYFSPEYAYEIDAYYQYYLHLLQGFASVITPRVTLYQNKDWQIELEISCTASSIRFIFRTTLTPILTGMSLDLRTIFPDQEDFNIVINSGGAYSLIYLESSGELMFFPLGNSLIQEVFPNYVLLRFTSRDWRNINDQTPTVYQNLAGTMEITFQPFDTRTGILIISLVYLF